MEAQKTYLINLEDLQEYGCPYCGGFSTSVFVEITNGFISVCNNCVNSFYVQENNDNSVLNYLDSYTKENIAVFSGNNSLNLEKPAKLINVGTFNTEGCFISGGLPGQNYSLILKAPAKKIAENIVKLFRQGASNFDEFIFIGAKKQHLPLLNKLMLNIIKDEKIDFKAVYAMQEDKY